MKYEVKTLNESSKRGWTVCIDGLPTEVSTLDIENDHIGTSLRYGQRPEGYDGFVIHERGGGGAVTAPYVVASRKLFVGTVLEDRPTQGGWVWNVPRGMLDADETHEQGAIREFGEETGYRKIGSRIIKLAEGLNCNSATYDTSVEGEGISVYAVPFAEPELEATDGEYMFPHGTIPLDNSKLGEKIVTARFKPIEEIMQLKDMFSVMAGGLVMNHLAEAK